MSKITNQRFDRLTNADIASHYRDREFYVCLSSLQAAFAYWVVAQNPNKGLIDIRLPLQSFTNYMASLFENSRLPEKFTYESLSDALTEDVFASIPDILKLNTMKPDFIDLSALARNIFYMVLREEITQAI